MKSSTLPMMAIKDAPQAKPDALEITALVKDKGYVVGYQLSDSSVVSKTRAIELAREGNIKGVGISENKGSEYLKSLPDDTEANNLGNLPSIPAGKDYEF